jgi:hypothetical protein
MNSNEKNPKKVSLKEAKTLNKKKKNKVILKRIKIQKNHSKIK